ncbi:MAG: nucleotidyltransferase family protein [Anaerolineae bacterium]|nr:nucleotidyltransferase family protein [Anaerolineae bacterium]MDW8099317.1 nucleotidyltransferase family protein [Anaerolineae bacterium]
MSLTIAQSPSRGDASWEAARFLQALTAPSTDALGAWLLTNELNTEAVSWLQRQRLAPYAFYRLREAGLIARLPQATQAALRSSFYATAAYNAVLTAELGALLASLRRREVEPIVLKGMALGITLYPVPNARPTSDLDLLVERRQMEAVRQVLVEREYRDMGLDPEHHQAFCNHLHAWRKVSNDLSVSVEAHWHLVHDPAYARHMDLRDLRARARRVDFGPFSALVLDPADQLIHACAHLLLHHGYNWSWLWLLDLHLLVERYGATWDWDELVSRAEALRLARALQYWLELAETWMGTRLPAQAKRALTSAQSSEEEEHRLYIARTQRVRVGKLLWLRARGAGGWRERLAYLAEALFPPWAYMQHRYGARSRWLAPLYYGWRIARAVVAVFRQVGLA